MLMSVEDGFAKEFALASHVETNRADDAGTPRQNEHCSGFCLDHAAAKERSLSLVRVGFQNAVAEGQGSAPEWKMSEQRAKGGLTMMYDLAEKHPKIQGLQQRLNRDVNAPELEVEKFALGLAALAPSNRSEPCRLRP